MNSLPESFYQIRDSKNVLNYEFGSGSLKLLEKTLKSKRDGFGVFLVDEFFEKRELSLPIGADDLTLYVATKDEPTTELVDELTAQIQKRNSTPSFLVGVGGGITMDVTKAISNLLTNGGRAENYQGWDLVKKPGVYKVAVPTISGTGAEASRTCVLMNYKKNLKLGMNSEFTVFDRLILDPDLTATVPRDQYFYTGMDTYIHCVESLSGHYKNAIGDAFSREALRLCDEVFTSNEDMQSDGNRAKLMVASYLGGCAIGNSYVGVVHPLSAGLSMVFGLHHCVANCIVMNVMEDFYPQETKKFQQMLKSQKINLPKNVTASLNDDQRTKLYEASIVHEKPLMNALGADFKKQLSKDRVLELFSRM